MQVKGVLGEVCLHVVLDNFKIHSSKAVAAAQLRWGDQVQLHFLPPQGGPANFVGRVASARLRSTSFAQSVHRGRDLRDGLLDFVLRRRVAQAEADC